MRVCSLGWENPLEEEMAAHPSILPGEPHGQRSLVGCLPYSCRESDATERRHRGAAGWRLCIIKAWGRVTSFCVYSKSAPVHQAGSPPNPVLLGFSGGFDTQT